MTKIMGKWPSGRRTTEKSGHWLAAEEKRFQRQRHLAAIAMKLMLIWDVSA